MSAALTYALCNEATATELAGDVLEAKRADMQAAYDEVFAPAWGVLPAVLVIGNDPKLARVLHLVDTIPEAPDALAYHTIDDAGRPVLRLGVETIRSNLAPGQNLLDEITKAITHEVFEAAINPFVSLFCYVAGRRAMLSFEVADPVQGGSFVMGSSAISNFVLPAYFDAEDLEGPFDQCGTLVAPLSCAADGYQAWSDGSQTFGAELPTHKRANVAKYGRLAFARITEPPATSPSGELGAS